MAIVLYMSLLDGHQDMTLKLGYFNAIKESIKIIYLN